MKKHLIIMGFCGCITYFSASVLPDALELRGERPEYVLVARVLTTLCNFGTWCVIGLAIADEVKNKN